MPGLAVALNAWACNCTRGHQLHSWTSAALNAWTSSCLDMQLQMPAIALVDFSCLDSDDDRCQCKRT
eukprot:5133071-Alexandrium_andersonii.AAC.1